MRFEWSVGGWRFAPLEESGSGCRRVLRRSQPSLLRCNHGKQGRAFRFAQQVCPLRSDAQPFNREDMPRQAGSCLSSQTLGIRESRSGVESSLPAFSTEQNANCVAHFFPFSEVSQRLCVLGSAREPIEQEPDGTSQCKGFFPPFGLQGGCEAKLFK